jgi:lysophospholipase L1-like esterase
MITVNTSLRLARVAHSLGRLSRGAFRLPLLCLAAALSATVVSAAPTIYVTGDSTVANYASGSYPQTGWGQVLQKFFDSSNVVISNKAVGGTSSRSFYNLYWAAIRDGLKAGDYVMIGFGINDRASDDARNTTPAEFKEFLTKYVNETKAKGAYPIIVSTINRSSWTSDGKIYPAYHEHPVVSRETAAELRVPLIDLDKLCTELLESVGKTYSDYFIYMGLLAGEYPNFSGGKSDTVHLQENGAYEMARLVVKAIRSLSSDANVSKLIPHLLPTYKVTVVRNNTAAVVTRSESFPVGARITLKVRTPSGVTFNGWSGDLSGSTNPNTSLTMTAAARQIGANFSSGTPPAAPAAPAGTTYECENGTRSGSSVPSVQTGSGGYSGTGYVDFQANGSTLTLNNVAGNGGGTKAIVIRYALGGTTARTGNLIVNGVTTSITFNPSGSFTTWFERTVNVTLNNNSTNTIAFSSTGSDFANLDRLTVPPGTSGADTYQAENATAAGGVAIESNNAGYNGTGFANFPTSGGTLTFNNVDGNGGGTKSLAIRYALGTTASRTGNLVVNGVTTAVTFSSTGSFTTWSTLNVNITLNNNATNTIQFSSTGADLGNIDEITVP